MIGIRRELWTPSPFIRIPFVDAMIEDEQRAAVFNKLQQSIIDRDQILMCFIAAVVDNDRVKWR